MRTCRIDSIFVWQDRLALPFLIAFESFFVAAFPSLLASSVPQGSQSRPGTFVFFLLNFLSLIQTEMSSHLLLRLGLPD